MRGDRLGQSGSRKEGAEKAETLVGYPPLLFNYFARTELNTLDVKRHMVYRIFRW